MSEESGISDLVLGLPPAWTIFSWGQGTRKGYKVIWAALFTTISFCPLLSYFSSAGGYNTSGERAISPCLLSSAPKTPKSLLSILTTLLPVPVSSLHQCGAFPNPAFVPWEYRWSLHSLQPSLPRPSQPSVLSEFPLRSPGILKADLGL